MPHSENLGRVIESVIEDANLSIEQRVDLLGQEIMANAFFLIEKVQRGQAITPEEDEGQAAMMKRFTEIQKVYNALMKSNRLSASGNATFNKGLLDAIKGRKSSISGIVVSNTKEAM